jgi:DNA polymerase kappa
VIYKASLGSKYFNNEEARDKNLTQKIERILAKKRQLEKLDLGHDLRKADAYLAELELSRDLSQTIVHIDCDAFFAAVEELDRPELKDVPFAVGGGRGGGVLTTCNYVARKFGCRSGMAGFVAKKLCPQLICLPLNHTKYSAKAEEVREVFVEYDPRFESASIDEAYLNITEYCQSHDIGPEDAVQQMRQQVFERTKITVSAGIAANAKIAKICSNMNKPNGQFRLPSDRTSIMEFMRDLPTRKVNGIGRVFERELDAVGVKTCGDIYDHRQYLSKLFGEKAFYFLVQCYLGLGRTTVQPVEEYERKSVGTESTFHEMKDPVELRNKLRSTAEELQKDLEKAEVKGRTLVLKVKLHTFEVFTRQVVPPKTVHLADDLYKYSLPMLTKLEQEIPDMKLRLMGLRCTHLVSLKKPDTLAFFGLKKKFPTDTNSTPPPDTSKRKADALDDSADGVWETLPDELMFEDAERQEREDELHELESLSQKIEEQQQQQQQQTDKQNDSADQEREEEEQQHWWDCPICHRPQDPDEKSFNAHIDLCLSRQTIRDALQETSNLAAAVNTSNEEGRSIQAPAKKARHHHDRGREKGPGVVAGDPKQRRLFFG